MLRAGIARSMITPPLGMTMVGYAGREEAAQGIDEDLTTTALVLESQGTRVAIVGFDLAFLQGELLLRTRCALADALGIPAAHVLINCSHTHCGPTMNAYYYDDDSEQHRMRAEYEAHLVEEMPRLAAAAVADLGDARLVTATGEARIGINRRELDDAGDIILGENPDGPVDHEVRVVRIDDMGGRPKAIVFAHGCHTVTMGPKCLQWSPDYVGPARRLVESALGCLSLFLQGNAGDIDPITGIGADEDNTDAKNRIGTTLGGEVLKVCSRLYSDTVRGPRTIFGMLAKASAYPRVAVSGEADTRIAVKEIPIELPLMEYPTLAQARELEETCINDLRDAKASGGARARLNVAQRYVYCARSLVDRVENKRKRALDATIQVISIDELAIAAFPGETFAASGMAVKEHSPFPSTLFLGYSNGCLTYIPTQDAYPPEGWSFFRRYHIPDMLFLQSYGVGSALESGTAEMVVDRTVNLLEEMYEKPSY
jgi:neutral ceramidase